MLYGDKEWQNATELVQDLMKLDQESKGGAAHAGQLLAFKTKEHALKMTHGMEHLSEVLVLAD
jgi:hypothetical protein